MNVRGSWLAVAVAVAGLMLTWHNVRATPMAVFQIKRKCADLEKLQALQSKNAQIFSAMNVLEAAGEPPSLAEVLANRNAEVRPRKDALLIEGWLLKSADVIFGEVALADAAAFVADAENARPAWRVAECAITPAGAPGFGRVALVLETIVMKAP